MAVEVEVEVKVDMGLLKNNIISSFLLACRLFVNSGKCIDALKPDPASAENTGDVRHLWCLTLTFDLCCNRPHTC